MSSGLHLGGVPDFTRQIIGVDHITLVFERRAPLQRQLPACA